MSYFRRKLSLKDLYHMTNPILQKRLGINFYLLRQLPKKQNQVIKKELLQILLMQTLEEDFLLMDERNRKFFFRLFRNWLLSNFYVYLCMKKKRSLCITLVDSIYTRATLDLFNSKEIINTLLTMGIMNLLLLQWMQLILCINLSAVPISTPNISFEGNYTKCTQG